MEKVCRNHFFHELDRLQNIKDLEKAIKEFCIQDDKQVSSLCMDDSLQYVDLDPESMNMNTCNIDDQISFEDSEYIQSHQSYEHDKHDNNDIGSETKKKKIMLMDYQDVDVMIAPLPCWKRKEYCKIHDDIVFENGIHDDNDNVKAHLLFYVMVLDECLHTQNTSYGYTRILMLLARQTLVGKLHAQEYHTIKKNEFPEPVWYYLQEEEKKYYTLFIKVHDNSKTSLLSTTSSSLKPFNETSRNKILKQLEISSFEQYTIPYHIWKRAFTGLMNTLQHENENLLIFPCGSFARGALYGSVMDVLISSLDLSLDETELHNIVLSIFNTHEIVFQTSWIKNEGKNHHRYFARLKFRKVSFLLDLKIYTGKKAWLALTYFTGPYHYVVNLFQEFVNLHYHKEDDSIGLSLETLFEMYQKTEDVHLESEQDVFDLVHRPYISPLRRTG